jgi:hypothetical protein
MLRRKPDTPEQEAAHVLAVAATTRLAYGISSPRPSAVRDASEALQDLGNEAVFMSNGKWSMSESPSWTPLTSAIIDCGVIGYDAESAFIFWVEEED